MTPKLISYKLCPFVHKAAIVLRAKNIAYDIRYISLSDPPDWFRDISPLGKVPLLLLDDDVLFGSSAIAEYLDEVYPVRLHPEDPVARAKNRAWMAFADRCIGDYYRLAGWKSASGYPKAREKLHSLFDQLETAVEARPFFNGPHFSLVDAAYGPLFFHLSILDSLAPGIFDADRHPLIVRWKETLIGHDAVRGAVVPDFQDIYLDWLGNKESYLGRLALKAPMDL